MGKTELPLPQGYKPPRTTLSRAFVLNIFRSAFGPQTELIDGRYIRITADGESVTIGAPDLLTSVLMALRPSVFVGEAFVRGKWYVSEGTLSQFFSVDYRAFSGAYADYFLREKKASLIRHIFQQFATTRRSTRRVKSHYNLDAKLYELFLDADLYYTCAFFESDHETLEQAQANKMDKIIERMGLGDDPVRVLDIGCGWGGADRQVIRRCPRAEVTGISISEEQIKYASERRDFLADDFRQRIRYLLQDYASFAPDVPFDAVFVIGMMEHVGLGDYRFFFERIRDFLRPGGTAVVHTIVCERSGIPTNPWIDRHIFPGAYAPSIAEVVQAAE